MNPAGPDPRDLLKLGMSDDLVTRLHGSSQSYLWEPPTVEELDPQLSGMTVLSLIGRGGMAAVYRVRNPDNTTAAIKLLPAELASDPVLEKRFSGEIDILTSLDHPRLIRVHRHGRTSSGLPYYVMDDMVDGDLGKAAPVPPEKAVVYIGQVCEGLAHLHEKGLLHRDLKPSNILLSENLTDLRIADFGLAKQSDLTFSQMSLTRTGAQVGTVHFLAPELYLDANSESVQSDLYSLGVIFYQLLTGKLPIGHFKKISEIDGVPRAADAVMMRALSSEPEARYLTAREFMRAVEEAFGRRTFVSRRTLLIGGMTTLAGGTAWHFSKPGPLVSGTTRTPRFDRPITHPWTSPVLWPGVGVEQMALNHLIAGAEAHLIHYAPGDSGPAVPGFSKSVFPGKSLTLESSASLALTGFPGGAHIDDLRLDGGTVSSDFARLVSPGDYPELNAALGDFNDSSGILSGKITILQTSTFHTGLIGKCPLFIESSLQGDSPIFIAPPRLGRGVEFSGDHSRFTGGWFVQGDLVFRGPLAGGSGGIRLDRGSLRVHEECTLGPLKVLRSGRVHLFAPTTFASVTLNGRIVPPGTYQRAESADALGVGNFEGEYPVIVLGEGGETPEIFLPRVTVLEEAPRVVSARRSGRWNHPDTWDGPPPIRARHDATGLTLPPIDYRVPEGIVLRGTFDPRGLEYFGGRSLTLEPGSVFEPEGNIGYLAFADLRLAGGRLVFGTKHSMFARELLGGNLRILAPTLFRMPDLSHLQPKDFVLQGTISGSHPIHVRGDRDEFLYINATTADFSGVWEIEEGTLAPLRNDALTGATVRLQKGNCWLRCYANGVISLHRLELTSEGRIEPKKAALRIEEMFIDGQRVPDGTYDHQSPEMGRILLAGTRKLTVGKAPEA